MSEQLDFTREQGWQYDQRYPPAAELLINGEGQPIVKFCYEGLIVAVTEKKMTPEQAKENYKRWFGLDFDFTG